MTDEVDYDKILETKNKELADLKIEVKQAKSQLQDFENCANRRKAKNERLVKKTMELDEENRVLEGKIEKYKASLSENTSRVNNITEEIHKMKEEYAQCLIKISGFEEMLREQEDENNKLIAEIETAKKDFESQQPELEFKKLDENELKKRLQRLQNNITKVKKDNSRLDYHLKMINDEDKLKSETISIISGKVSQINSPAEPKREKSNDLTMQMKAQLEEIMKLYQDINSLKLEKKAWKLKQAELSNQTCKCTIQ